MKDQDERSELPTSDIDELIGKIVAIFAGEFKLEAISPDDDFFELGGDSLMAERLALRLTELSRSEFRLSSLFKHPSPRSIALFLAADNTGPIKSEASTRPPVFLVHGISGYTVPSPLFHEGLAAGQRLELFQLPGLMGRQAMPETVEEMAAAYVEQIEREWPKGRVHLAAFCIVGALIAMEIARQMEARGRPIDHLVLLDPHAPSSTLRRRFLGQKARLSDRLLFFPVTGRFSGGLGPKDLKHLGILRMRRRLNYWDTLLQRARSKLTGYKALRFQSGRNLWAMATLHAATREAWPTPFAGPADVICTVQQAPVLDDPAGFWRWALPNMKLWPVLESHQDVVGSETSVASSTMQSCFDAGEGRGNTDAGEPERPKG